MIKLYYRIFKMRLNILSLIIRKRFYYLLEWVFEVGKPVSKDEISMLYELVPCDKKKHSTKIKIERDDTSSEDDRTETFRPVREIYQVVPTHRAEEFMDAEWKMNEDHLMMCREFLGKRCTPQRHRTILLQITIVLQMKCTEI